MHLSTARLCLDCEEVHDAQTCPVCASTAFSYLSRWVPVPEPRKRRPRPITPEAATYQRLIDPAAPARGNGLLKKGVIGLTAVGLFGWLWRSSQTGKTRATNAEREKTP